MKSKRRRISIFFWIAFCMYLISLILPYTVLEYYSSNNQFPERTYSSGFDAIIPVFCLLPILALTILIYVRHTNFSRWTTLIICSLMIFPTLPFLYFVTTFSLYGVSYPAIGFYVNCVSFVLFLIPTIIKFGIPAKRNQQVTTIDVLDDF